MLARTHYEKLNTTITFLTIIRKGASHSNAPQTTLRRYPTNNVMAGSESELDRYDHLD